MRTLERSEPQAPDVSSRGGGRPVMLATLEVPFDAQAVVFAVDSAVELGERLIVANFAERAPLPLSTMLGYDDLPYPPELAESLLAAAKLAGSLGVEVTRLRVKSFHPIQAMLEVLAEQGAGIFVFGPDRSRIGRLQARYHLVKLRFISVNDMGRLGPGCRPAVPREPGVCSPNRADGRKGLLWPGSGGSATLRAGPARARGEERGD